MWATIFLYRLSASAPTGVSSSRPARALARQRLAPILLIATILAGDVGSSGQQRQQGIVPQPVVVVEVFVAQSQSHDPLPQ